MEQTPQNLVVDVLADRLAHMEWGKLVVCHLNWKYRISCDTNAGNFLTHQLYIAKEQVKKKEKYLSIVQNVASF